MLSLYDKYPFLMKYFSRENVSKISHCILFFGSDAPSQYELALEVARLLNCKEDGAPDCECLNCKWIRENQHPAVRTVSRVDYKPTDDKTKTVISVRQTQEIKKDLMVTSDYHRVIIFCDKDDDGNVQGINYRVFQEEAANSLLKTFEEPPSNTTFIFLTKDKTDMISTIVSRSQCFFVPAQMEENRDFSFVSSIMEGYMSRDKNDVWNFKDELLAIIKEHGFDTTINQVESYLNSLLKSNYQNGQLRIKLLNDLKAVSLAKKQAALDIQAPSVIENLSFALFNIN
ncbi:MAG: hypothetical protein NC390_04315 [Fusobacterium sp.]|nr:hypothetical protein [Fusobacterium sp.]